MKDGIFRKGLVCAVIFLFIGLAFVPSLSVGANKTISENDTVEFIVMPCGIKGVKPKLVRLTSQEANKLDKLMDSMKGKLENTTTNNEANIILKDMVVELNKYGLLPEHMSVEKVQQLVVNKYKNQVATTSGDKENFNCQVIGKSRQHFDNEMDRYWEFLDKIMDSFQWVPGYILLVLLIYARIWVIQLRFLFLFHLVRDDDLVFGVYRYYLDDEYRPLEIYMEDSGWVLTYNGSNGNVSWFGNLWGLIRQNWDFIGGDHEEKACYFTGMTDFTGVDIFEISYFHNYFFGSASHVKLGPNPPPLNPN